MKKNQKYIIIVLIAITILCAVIYIVSANKSKISSKSKIQDLPLTYEYVETNFYYEQLTPVERNVYDKLTEKLDAYEGGEILLDKKISVNSLSRIADAMRFNDRNNYFYSLFTYPFTDDNKLVNWYPNQSKEELEKKQIRKILLDIYIGENDTRLNNLNLTEDATVTNFDEQKHIFETIPENLVSKYDTVKKETNQMLDDITTNMPKDLNQEEAVNYFSQWIIDNMSYTSSFTSETQYGDIANEDVQFSSSLASLTNENAVCAGFAMILSELCKRVGIESYVCLGTSSYGGSPADHAWTAVIIGNTTYYTDPTVGVGTQTVSRLKTRDELTKGSYILRLRTDEFDF